MSRVLRTIVIACALSSVALGQAFDRLVSFGDSLSDVGNVNNQTFGVSPGSGYYQGRFSNGPLWIDSVSASLNLGASTASRLGGNNFATGGTRSGSGYVTPFFLINLPNAGTQVNTFLASRTPTANDLVTIWTGGNDFLDGQTDPTLPATNVKNLVTQLSNAGIRNIAVANLPPLGETPRYRTTANRATMNTRSTQFNASLASQLDALAPTLAATVYRIDVAGFFNDVLANPGAYGIVNTTDRAFRTDNTVVANPDGYLFWDDVHPTRAAHGLLGSRAFEAVTNRHFVVSTGEWAVSGNWSAKRVPDATSAVTIDAAATASLASIATVRTFMLTPSSRLSLDLAPGSPRLTIAGTAILDGEIGVGFASGVQGLPGDVFPLLSFASASGTPTLANETNLAGLRFESIATATSLSVRLGGQAGDANLDNAVDFDDLLTVARHYGETTLQTWLTGDFNRDAAVGFDDLLALAQNYGAPAFQSGGPSLAEAFAGDWILAESLVPEPSFILALLVLVSARRRDSHATSIQTA